MNITLASSRHAAAAGALLAGLAFAAPAMAITTWDLAGDYPTTAVNPNGAWTYGWEQTLNGSLTAYDLFAGSQWYDSQHHSGDNTPTVWKNTGTGPAYGIPVGAVSLHPGWDGSFSVARWTAPAATTVNVSGSFGAGDIGSMSDYIAVNGVTLRQWPSNSGDAPFDVHLELAAGDTLDFIVGVPIGGGYGFGNTPVWATVTTVPEPGAWALWLAGLGLVALRRGRRDTD